MSIWNSRTADDLPTQNIIQRLLLRGYLSDAHPSAIIHCFDKLRARFQHLKKSFPDNTLHTLAVKANPLPAVLRLAVEEGLGLEAASLGEIVDFWEL